MSSCEGSCGTSESNTLFTTALSLRAFMPERIHNSNRWRRQTRLKNVLLLFLARCRRLSSNLGERAAGNKWSKGSKRTRPSVRPSVHCVCHCSHITVKMKSPNVSNCDLGIEREPTTNERTAGEGRAPFFTFSANLVE